MLPAAVRSSSLAIPIALLWRHAWPSVDGLDDGSIIAQPEADVHPRVGDATGERETIIHSMTSSARSSSDCGIVRPRALAVLRLMNSWNLVGCSTGRSAGFAPLSMRST